MNDIKKLFYNKLLYLKIRKNVYIYIFYFYLIQSNKWEKREGITWNPLLTTERLRKILFNFIKSFAKNEAVCAPIPRTVSPRKRR